MDVVIIAAGKGTRMRPLTERRPKPLLPVGETTLLERTLDCCAGVADRFLIVVGYRGTAIKETIGDTYARANDNEGDDNEGDGIPVKYVEQTDPCGTADAIAQVAPYVDAAFLVANGDVVIDRAVAEQLAATPDGEAAMAVRSVSNPSSYGVVETTADGDRITGLVEKPDSPPTDLINAGLYVLPPTVFDHIQTLSKSDRGEYELTDAISRVLADGQPVVPVTYDGPWFDVGRPWDLLEANSAVLESLEARRDGTIEAGATLTGPVVVEEGARVRAGAYIEGPVVIKAGADVGPNAYVRGASVIGPDTRVGNSVEIKNSILFADTAVGHLSYVGDSILGSNVNFGAGTVVANLRHDDESVAMTVKGDRVDTGRRKLGVVVGDDTKTGIDTSLNAGVKLGVGTRTLPDETVLDDRLSN